MLTLSELWVLSSMSCHPAKLSKPLAGLLAGELCSSSVCGAAQECIVEAKVEGYFYCLPQRKLNFFTQFLIQNLRWIKNTTFFTGDNILGDSHCSECLVFSSQSGEELPCSLLTMSHHWDPAEEGEESIFIREKIERNFLLKMFMKRFFQPPLHCSPMEETGWKLGGQRCHQPKCSGIWWSDFSLQILKIG